MSLNHIVCVAVCCSVLQYKFLNHITLRWGVSLHYFTCGVLMCVSLYVWLRCTCVAVYVPESHHLCCSAVCVAIFVSRVVSWCVCLSLADFCVYVLRCMSLKDVPCVAATSPVLQCSVCRNIVFRVVSWCVFLSLSDFSVAVCVSTLYELCCRESCLLRWVLQCVLQYVSLQHMNYDVLRVAVCVAVCVATLFHVWCLDVCVSLSLTSVYMCCSVSPWVTSPALQCVSLHCRTCGVLMCVCS